MTGIFIASSPVLNTVTLENFAAEAPFNDLGAATQLYEVDIRFKTNGLIDINRLRNANTLNIYCAPAGATANLWVRVTVTSGNDLDEVSESRGVWVPWTSELRYVLSYTSTGGLDTITSVTTFEIATDSGGANIVASETLLNWEVGETV